jgi:hypothetical protein
MHGGEGPQLARGGGWRTGAPLTDVGGRQGEGQKRARARRFGVLVHSPRGVHGSAARRKLPQRVGLR